MATIKDEKQAVESLSKMLDLIGEGAEDVSGKVDEVIFNYINFLCINNECVGVYDANLIFILKEIRDFFNEIQTA